LESRTLAAPSIQCPFEPEIGNRHKIRANFQVRDAAPTQDPPAMPISIPPFSIAQRLLPVLGWLPAYRRDWLLPDAMAALAVWAVMVPEGMAYAAIVGVPPIMGLYTIIPPLIAYALLGTSRVLVVGPDTATGLISALTVGTIVAQGTAHFDTLTSTLAILIGVFFLLFGALRMGWVAAFIPTPVMRGFIEGLVCVTIIGQVRTCWGSAARPAASSPSFGSCSSIYDAALAPVLTGRSASHRCCCSAAWRQARGLLVVVVANLRCSLLGEAAVSPSVTSRPAPHFTASSFDPLLRGCPGARHRFGRLCRSARRGKGRSHAGRRRNRSEPGAGRAWARQHPERAFRRLPRRR
jgi:hypothetical protein